MAGVRARRPSDRRRWLAPLGVLVALALLVGWWQPWRARPATSPRPAALVPTATPIPPTPTLVPQRIIPPPATPLAATITPVASAPRATVADAQAGLSAGSIVLYIGRHDGQEGILAIDADGTNRRLLTAGRYEAIAWSPGGNYFAAVGPLQAGLTSQVAIFTPDGRALARYAFDGIVPQRLVWSPDGSKLAGSVYLNGANPVVQSGRSETWQILLQRGVYRVSAPDTLSLLPFGWTPHGTLLAWSYHGANIRTIYLVSDDGSTIVEQFTGAFTPLALSGDGESLYILGQTDQSPIPALYAVDLRTDQLHLIAGADRLGALADGRPPVDRRYSVSTASVAPDESHIAVIIQGQPQSGTPTTTAEQVPPLLIILRPNGEVTGILRLAPGLALGPFAWSPDGNYLAFYGTANGVSRITTGNSFIVVDSAGVQRADLPFYVGAIYGGMTISWSPDGHWLTYASIAGISLVRAETGQATELVSPAGSPAWRPTR